MIKSEELRHTNIIGDEDGVPMYLNYLKPSKQGWRYVDSAGNTGLLKQCNGIPLTEQWLLKFGFTQNDYSVDKGWYNEPFYKIELESKGWIVGWDETLGWYIAPRTSQYNVVSIKTVHKLQNLYFALTGEELTINQ